jgi:hypothetical protein
MGQVFAGEVVAGEVVAGQVVAGQVAVVPKIHVMCTPVYLPRNENQ